MSTIPERREYQREAREALSSDGGEEWRSMSRKPIIPAVTTPQSTPNPPPSFPVEPSPRESVSSGWWPARSVEWWRGQEPWPRDDEDDGLRVEGER
jgi:hypothetical protein